MKRKMKKVLPFVITAGLSLCAGIALVALLFRPQALKIGEADLKAIADGAYIGVCQNKILFAVVEVEVENHQITDVEVLAHKPSYMEQAERIAENVCAAQSLKVDAISGATLTSDTVLKAIENALEVAGKASGRKQVEQ